MLFVILVLSGAILFVIRLRVRCRDTLLVGVLYQLGGQSGGDFADVTEEQIDAAFTQVVLS